MTVGYFPNIVGNLMVYSRLVQWGSSPRNCRDRLLNATREFGDSLYDILSRNLVPGQRGWN